MHILYVKLTTINVYIRNKRVLFQVINQPHFSIIVVDVRPHREIVLGREMIACDETLSLLFHGMIRSSHSIASPEYFSTSTSTSTSFFSVSKFFLSFLQHFFRMFMVPLVSLSLLQRKLCINKCCHLHKWPWKQRVTFLR